MVICLQRGAGLHMAQLMPLPLTVSCFSKIQIGLPFWHQLTRVCVCVHIYNVGGNYVHSRGRGPRRRSSR